MFAFKDTLGESALRQQLTALLKGPKKHAAEEWKKVVRSWARAFVQCGSETPDNVSCAKNVDYGPLSAKFHRATGLQGLRIKGSRIPLSALAHALEDLDLPKDISEQFPDLTNEQWSAFLRVVTMLLLRFEHPSKIEPRSVGEKRTMYPSRGA
jgi:hypothetical protein